MTYESEAKRVRGLETVPRFKAEIVNTMVVQADADEVASHWREQGFKVRVVSRIVRALGASMEVWAVVLVGNRWE